MQIKYTSIAKKDFKKLFNTQYKNDVIEVLNVLKENPFYLFPPLEILNGYNNRYSNQPRPSVYDYTELEYETRYDAEVALYKIKDILEHQHFVSVGDYFEASEVRPTSADYDYGWTSLAGVEPRISRNGKFYLTLAKPMPLER